MMLEWTSVVSSTAISARVPSAASAYSATDVGAAQPAITAALVMTMARQRRAQCIMAYGSGGKRAIIAHCVDDLGRACGAFHLHLLRLQAVSSYVCIDDRTHPLRPQSHRLPAYRRRSHSAVLLARIASSRWPVHPAHRGHRSRALN